MTETDLERAQSRLESILYNEPPPPIVFERGDHVEIAERLLDTIDCDRTSIVRDDGQLWHFERGAWHPLTHRDLSARVMGFAGAKCGNNVLRVYTGLISGGIECAGLRVDRPGFFADAPHGVAFANGFATIRDGAPVLVPHDRAQHSRCALPFNYAPELEHPKLDGYFATAWRDADDLDDRVQLVQEFYGACLLGMATKYQRCLLKVGPGGNGKSQLDEIFRPLLGQGIVSISPHRWGERFTLARFVGARMNIVGEVPSSELMSTDTFKSVIAGEHVSAEIKHGALFMLRPEAGHSFSCNNIPSTSDLSAGFFRRFLLLRFDQRLDLMAGRIVEYGAQVGRAEAQAIASWLVAGAARLERQGHYTEPRSHEATLVEWRRTSDSVAVFVDEECITERDGRAIAHLDGERAGQLYASYQTWAGSCGYEAITSKAFAHRMAAIGLASERKEKGMMYPVTRRRLTVGPQG